MSERNVVFGFQRREDDVGGNVLTVCHHAGNAAGPCEDPFDPGGCANLRARASRGSRHRLGAGAGTTARDQRTPSGKLSVRQSKEQGECASGRTWRQHRPRETAGGHHRANAVVLEPLVREVIERHGQPSQEILRGASAETPEAPTRLKHLPDVADAGARDSCRRCCQEWRQHCGHAGHRVPVPGPRVGVRATEGAQFGGRPRRIVVDDDRWS